MFQPCLIHLIRLSLQSITLLSGGKTTATGAALVEFELAPRETLHRSRAVDETCLSCSTCPTPHRATAHSLLIVALMLNEKRRASIKRRICS